MPRPKQSTRELVDFAHHLADASGKAILPHFRQAIPVDNKASDGGYDPVTVADRAAEQAIRRMVEAAYPDHGFEGEELGSSRKEAAWRWVIDPIDGTRAFVIGLPVWGTMIALTHEGVPVLGLIDQPYTRERFWSTGERSMFRGPDGRERRLATRVCRDLSKAMMTTTHPEMFRRGTETARFRRVRDRVRSCRYGGDCYAYCLLAAGHIDVIVEAGLKPFDVAALVPIIESAGGRITTWSGGPAGSGGRIVATGDPRLHEEVLRLLA